MKSAKWSKFGAVSRALCKRKRREPSTGHIAWTDTTVGEAVVRNIDGELYSVSVEKDGTLTDTSFLIGADNIEECCLTGSKLEESTITSRELDMDEIFGDATLLNQTITENLDTEGLFNNEGFQARFDERLQDTIFPLIRDTFFPVGTIIKNVNPAKNPGLLMGGTWEPWGAGCITVGYDSTQSEFDAIEKKGGAKTHAHDVDAAKTYAEVNYHGSTGRMILNNLSVPGLTYTQTLDPAGGASLVFTAANMSPPYNRGAGTRVRGGTLSSSNLQPYIVACEWKRTA